MKCSNLQLRQVEPLSEHIYADHDPRLPGYQLSPDFLSLGVRLNSGMQLDRVELRVALIAVEYFLSSGDVRYACHQNMSELGIRPKLSDGGLSNCHIAAGWVELDNGLEVDRLEVVLLLGVPQ